MCRVINLRKEQLVIILCVSFGALTIAQPSGAKDACSDKAEEATLKQRETALLGQSHAAQHVEARARQCRVAQGLEKVSSPDAQALAAVGPSNKVGRWSAPFVIPVVGVTSVLLNNGKVLFWSYDPAQWLNQNASNIGVAYVWTPATRTGHYNTPPENIWCSGQTILSDGRVYLAGGNFKYPDP